MLGRKLGEELEPRDAVLVLVNIVGAMRQDHVVQALIRRTGRSWLIQNDVEVIRERSFPVEFLVLGGIELRT